MSFARDVIEILVLLGLLALLFGGGVRVTIDDHPHTLKIEAISK